MATLKFIWKAHVSPLSFLFIRWVTSPFNFR